MSPPEMPDFPAHIVILNVFFAPYTYGGATVVAEQVAQALQRDHGRRITAISVVQRTDLVPYTVMKVEKDGIPNYLINLPHGRSYTEGYINPRVSELVAGLLDVLRPDLIHAHCLQELGAGVLHLARRRGVPVVLSVHDFWWICERQFMIRPNQRYCGQDPVRIADCQGCVDSLPRARMRQETLLDAAAQADLITFPSRFAHDLSVRSGMRADRMAVWENGVRHPGPGFFEEQAARRARDPRPVFGFVGGPSQIKGWPLIRAAFEGLNTGSEPHFGKAPFAGLLVEGSLDNSWWAGQDILKMAGDWRVYPRFTQAEMDGFYGEIDVLLFLSQWKETFGLTIREALARGIRVIQTDSGGTTEWDGADRSDMLAIGDGAGALRQKIRHELDRADPYADPRPVASYADQAQAFLDLVSDLGGRRR